MKSSAALILLPIIAGIFLTVTLFAHVNSAHSDFVEYHNNLSKQLILDIKNQIEGLLEHNQRSVNIFTEGNIELIEKIHNDPNKYDSIMLMEDLLKRHFPNFLAYTIANKEGERLVDPFMEKVGELCQKDIDIALQRELNPVFVHPGPDAPHIDFVSRWKSASSQIGVLLVSMSTDILVNTLNKSQPVGHKFYLLRNDVKNLIELTSEGLRRHIDRPPKLEDHELTTKTFEVNVNDTNWTIIDIIDQQFIADNYKKHTMHAVITIFAYIIVSAFLVYFLIKEKKQREETEEKLESITNIIPICSYCKKIRDDDGEWARLEKYISDHFEDTSFSHGICPVCMEEQRKKSILDTMR